MADTNRSVTFGTVFGAGALLVAGVGVLLGISAGASSAVAAVLVWLASLLLAGAGVLALPSGRRRIGAHTAADLTGRTAAAAVAGVTVLSVVIFFAGIAAVPAPPDDGGAAPATPTTATPTPTATATASPTSTSTPTGTPTPTPAATPAPDGESYSYQLSGADVTDQFSIAGGLVAVELSHTGESNFIVELVNVDTGDRELLVNQIGSFDGEVARYVPPGTYLLDVDADGQWQATVEQPRFSVAEVRELPVEEQGSQHDYLGPFEFEGVTEISVQVPTDSYVGVWLADHEGRKVELLVNDVGPVDATTVVTETGYGLIIIETGSESWTVQIG